MEASESLMPGPEGKTPRFYEVDRGQKTESYINAVSGNPVTPSSTVHYSKVNDEVITSHPPPSSNGKQKKPSPVGLTEEELAKYRECRSWKCFRLILFVLFWILWILMFIIAILLVVFSPGCTVIIRPNWWQTAVTYNVWVPSFQDSNGDGSGDVTGLISRLHQLRKSGVQTIWPSPFLLSDNLSKGGSAVRHFHQMDSSIGVNQDSDRLIEEVHKNDMKIVINIPIATTSVEHEWFLASSTASKPENRNYSQFYYWVERDGESEYFTSSKGLHYLHEKKNPGAPVLNWQTHSVREKMFEVFSYWIDRGVDGFYLQGIEYLARTPNGLLPNWAAIADIIRDIRHHVDTHASESILLAGRNTKIALFASREDAKEQDKRQLAIGGLDSIVNYELGRVAKDTDICHKNEGTVATCVHEIISDVLLFHSQNENVWPQWEFGNAWISRLASRVGSRTHSELLAMLQLVLPGTNNVYYGDEIGMRDLPNDTNMAVQRGAMQWEDGEFAGFTDGQRSMIPINSDFKNINWKRQYEEEKSPLKMFSKLAKLRQRDDTLGAGKTLVGNLIDGAFSLTRFLQRDNMTVGHVYITIVNFSSNQVKLSLVDQPRLTKSSKAQVVAETSKSPFRVRQHIDLSSQDFELSGETGVVIRYSA